MGKALADKPISVDGILETLGKILCADGSMVWKEMGDNMFLSHFNHQDGMKRALEDGPSMAGHSLIILAPYDGSKTLDPWNLTMS